MGPSQDYFLWCLMIPTLVASPSFLIVMLVTTRGVASVLKGRHDVSRCGGDRGWVTPDWEVFGCALSPFSPSILLVGVRWRDVGENSSQQVGVDFIAPEKATLLTTIVVLTWYGHVQVIN